jgi:hypothetical protein
MKGSPEPVSVEGLGRAAPVSDAHVPTNVNVTGTLNNGAFLASISR